MTKPNINNKSTSSPSEGLIPCPSRLGIGLRWAAPSKLRSLPVWSWRASRRRTATCSPVRAASPVRDWLRAPRRWPVRRCRWPPSRSPPASRNLRSEAKARVTQAGHYQNKCLTSTLLPCPHSWSLTLMWIKSAMNLPNYPVAIVFHCSLFS